MEKMNINQLVGQMNALAAQAKGVSSIDEAAPEAKSSFANLMKQSIDQVNQAQMRSSELKEGYEKGDPNVNLTQVMVEAQKASVSFQAMLQVRNKLVEAYKDITSMPL